MAPKRAGATKTAPAKRAKTAAPEAPLLEFLGKCDEIPKPCREMLQAAVPICLEVVEAERHKFQIEVLERVSALLSTVEGQKREVISGHETELAEIGVEKDKAAAELDTRKAASAGKKAECDSKQEFVDKAMEVSNAAKKELEGAQAAKAEFDSKKEGLLAEQEGFAKLLGEVFNPLKDGSCAAKGFQKTKLIDQLKKKLKELGAQESLGDALAATLKMTPEKREGTFAKATMQFAEEYFTKHTAKVAADIGGLDGEEASLTAAIAKAEGVATEKKAALDDLTKEWDAMQDIWIGLSNEEGQAEKELKKIEARIPRVNKNIDKSKFDLEKFLEIPELFAKLKEKSTAAPEEPEEPAEEEKAEEAAEAEAKPDEEMQG